MIGTRVVRGPDWFLNGSLEDEDGGEGNVGTIISIVEYNSRAFQEVKVLWDTGETSICRCGPKGYQDLRVVDEHFVSLKEEAGRKTKLQGTFLGATIHPGPGFYWHSSVGIGAARLPGYTPQDKRQIGVLHQSLPGNGFFLIDWANGFKSQHQRVDEGKCVFTLISPGVFGFYDPAELPALESGTQQDPPVVLKTGDFVQFKFGYPQRELNAGGRFGCTGRITGVLRGGKELDVIFGGHSTRQLPSVLLKVNKFSVGDRVKITNDPGMTADLFKASGDVQKFAGAPGTVTNTDLSEIQKVFLEFDDPLLDIIHVDPITKKQKFWMTNLLEMISVLPQPELQPNALLSPRDSLITAIKRKDLNTMKSLLAGSDVNSSLKFDSFPLHLASQYGFLEGVRWFHLNAGAFLDQRDENGDLVTHCAASGDHETVLRYVLHGGVNPDVLSRSKRSAFHNATNVRSNFCALALLEAGCNVNTLDIVRRTPIHDAICNDMRDVVRAIPSPINLSVHSIKGYTPLHECVKKPDRFRMAQLIVNRLYELDDPARLAILEEKDDNGMTPLLFACLKRRIDIIELFVEAGADVLAVDSKGNNALMILIQSSERLVLPRQETNRQIFDWYSRTLSLPASEKLVRSANLNCILAYLKEKGCSMDTPNTAGKTARTVISEKNIAPI